MLNILFFIENLSGGGAEKVLRNLVNNMDQTKFCITVETVWPADAKQYLKEGVRCKSMYPVRNGFYNLIYRLEAAFGLAYPLHIKAHYDIECAYLECGATKVMAGSTNKKAVKLAWVHCDLVKKVENIEGFVKKASGWYRKFDKVVCVSEGVRESYVRLFGNDPEAVVLYNTIDDDEIRTKAGLPLQNGLKKRRCTVVSAGRLTRQKRFDRLLKAHKNLAGEGLEYDLWILGEGQERPELEMYIEANELTDSVHMFGFQGNPYPFIASADVLVCSSDYEGLSTFITEGLILGKPIVTTDCTGMRELLGDGEYGLITDTTEDGIGEGMRKVLSNAEVRAAYAVKAAGRGKKFSARAMVQQTENFFEEAFTESHK